MNAALQQSTRSALILLAFAAISTAILGLIYFATLPQIQANETAARLHLLAQVLPKNYDNSPVDDVLPLSEEDCQTLQSQANCRAHIAKRGGQILGYAIEAVAPNGYAGAIRLLIGIDPQGKVLAVRVLHHRETPGLGDYIDRKKSDWIEQLSNHLPNSVQWKVKKDGGDFDFMSGATISARAVTAAVGRTQAWFMQSTLRRDHSSIGKN